MPAASGDFLVTVHPNPNQAPPASGSSPHFAGCDIWPNNSTKRYLVIANTRPQTG